MHEVQKIFSIHQVYKPQDMFQHKYAIFIQLSSSARGTIEPAEEVPGEDGEGGACQGEHEHHQHQQGHQHHQCNEGLFTLAVRVSSSFPNSVIFLLMLSTKVRMLSIITGSYLIFWGPLFVVTVWHWSWGWEEAKKSLAHEVC